MKRLAVSSTDVESVGFEISGINFVLESGKIEVIDRTGTLEIEFKTRAVYQYFDVPESTYNQIMRARSVGGTLHALVKKPRAADGISPLYEFRKIA